MKNWFISGVGMTVVDSYYYLLIVCLLTGGRNAVFMGCCWLLMYSVMPIACIEKKGGWKYFFVRSGDEQTNRVAFEN